MKPTAAAERVAEAAPLTAALAAGPALRESDSRAEPRMVGSAGMTASSAGLENFQAAFASQGRGAGEPEWFSVARTGAWDSFARAGFPTSKNEDWKYTSVSAIAEGAYRISERSGVVTLPELPGCGISPVRLWF